MAGFVALGNNQYIGTLINKTADLENGQFVTVDWAKGECVQAVDDTAGDGDVLFVCNEIDTIVEQTIDDVDFKIPSGAYLKLKVPQKGEIFVTTKYKVGSPAVAVGDTVAVGNDGTLEAVGSRTPKFKFAVLDITSYLGADALSVVAL